MLCPQHTLSRCGRVGPQIFMRKPITHPCLPTRFPLVCMTFCLFRSVWPHCFLPRVGKPFQPKRTWSIVPHSMVKKECVVRVNPRVIRCSLRFRSFSHMSVFGRRNVSMILLAIRKWRCDVCFTFFVVLFLPPQWCWSRSFFMLWGAWCAALLTDLKQ